MTKQKPPQAAGLHNEVRSCLHGKGAELGITLFLKAGTVGPVTYLYAALVKKPVTLQDLNDPLDAMLHHCKGCGRITRVTFGHHGDHLRIGRLVIEEEADSPTQSVVVMLYPSVPVAVARLKRRSPFSSLPFEVPSTEVFGPSAA